MGERSRGRILSRRNWKWHGIKWPEFERVSSLSILSSPPYSRHHHHSHRHPQGPTHKPTVAGRAIVAFGQRRGYTQSEILNGGGGGGLARVCGTQSGNVAQVVCTPRDRLVPVTAFILFLHYTICGCGGTCTRGRQAASQGGEVGR